MKEPRPKNVSFVLDWLLPEFPPYLCKHHQTRNEKEHGGGFGDAPLFSGTDDHLTFLTISINFSVSIFVPSGLSAEAISGQVPDVITFPSTTTPVPE